MNQNDGEFNSETVSPNNIKSFSDGFILTIRVQDKRMIPRFLFYMFQSNSIENEIINNTRGTTGITSIRTQSILNFTIPLPSINTQKNIVRKIDECFESIDKARANVEKNLQNAKDLLRSRKNAIFKDLLNKEKKQTD